MLSCHLLRIGLSAINKKDIHYNDLGQTMKNFADKPEHVISKTLDPLIFLLVFHHAIHRQTGYVRPCGKIFRDHDADRP